jgi:hypothetical protein
MVSPIMFTPALDHGDTKLTITVPAERPTQEGKRDGSERLVQLYGTETDHVVNEEG